MALGVNCHLEEKDAMHSKDGGGHEQINITTLRKKRPSMVMMAEVVKHDHYDHHHHGRGQIRHDHDLEEKDA